MIEIKSEKMNYGIKFPSSINEITPEILETITAKVKLPKYYCIVALCFKTRVFDFCTMISSNNINKDISVVPLLAKISDEDSTTINAKVGDKIIIDRSSLERSSRINIPVSISSENAKRYFKSDEQLSRAIITKDDNIISNSNINKQLLKSNSPDIVIMEFKVVAINDIVASTPMDNMIQDPFIIKDEFDA